MILFAGLTIPRVQSAQGLDLCIKGMSCITSIGLPSNIHSGEITSTWSGTPGSIPTSLGRWNGSGDGQQIGLEDVLRTLAAHSNDILRTSVGPKMVALSSKNMFSKNI